MELDRKGADVPSQVEGLVRNLSFTGLEWTRHGTEDRFDRFHVNVAGRQVYFHKYSLEKQLKELIEIDRIDRAILSEIHVPLVSGEKLEDALAILERVEWLTALLTMNRTFAPVVKLTDRGQLCGWRVMELGSDPFRGGGVVDNYLTPGGIKAVLEEVYETFVTLEPKLSLCRFIDMVLVMRSQRQLEFMLAGLLLA